MLLISAFVTALATWANARDVGTNTVPEQNQISNPGRGPRLASNGSGWFLSISQDAKCYLSDYTTLAGSTSMTDYLEVSVSTTDMSIILQNGDGWKLSVCDDMKKNCHTYNKGECVDASDGIFAYVKVVKA